MRARFDLRVPRMKVFVWDFIARRSARSGRGLRWEVFVVVWKGQDMAGDRIV